MEVRGQQVRVFLSLAYMLTHGTDRELNVTLKGL